MNKAQQAPPQAAISQFKVETRRRKSVLTNRARAPLAGGNGAQAQALAAFSALGASCATATATVNQNPLGPYADNGSCHYDCSKEQTWSWQADYRGTNTNLGYAVNVMNNGGSYNRAFQPTQKWVSTTLPAYGGQLAAGVLTIQHIDAAIVQAGGQETPAQGVQLAAAFSTSTALLQSNMTQINQGLQGLAGFIVQQSPNASYLQNYVGTSKTFIITNATNTENDLISKISCGAGNVQNSFNGLFADVNTKYAAMQVPFNAVTTGFQAALQASQQVAGVFLPLQSNNQLVALYLSQAQAYPPTSALRTLRLNMATSLWNALQAQATTQLG